MITPQPNPAYATLEDWIAHEAIPFALDSDETFNHAVDTLVATLGDALELLGLGEAMHGGEEFLLLRNRIFQRLVEKHGYTAIALESSFPRGHFVNEYIAGRGPASYDDLCDIGFSHEFGKLDTSRELIEWMRAYNADPAHPVKLHFYGFDAPMEATGTESPRQLLQFALDYLAAVEGPPASPRAQRFAALLGADAPWENPAAMMDPTQSIGLSAEATALRIETENLITEMHIRRPELVARSDAGSFREALHYLTQARGLLTYHAALAANAPTRLPDALGQRDALMAENLIYILERERARAAVDAPRGAKVMVFAHNSHLKRGQAAWQMGPTTVAWWPAGAHIGEVLGTRYAMIGTGLGASPPNGIAPPEPGTLEALLLRAPGPARLIPTHLGHGLPAAQSAALPPRTAGTRNYSYFIFTPQSFTDFDWLIVLDSATYWRGGRPLP